MNTKEVLNYLNTCKFEQLVDFYKGVAAYSLGMSVKELEEDKRNAELLDKMMEIYFDDDEVICFINEKIYEYGTDNFIAD